jgi:hypothetical protein
MALPYDRREKETEPAFQAFVTYRDMGLGARSIIAVSQQLGKSETLISRWSKLHDWVKRVRAYDIEVDRRKRLGELRAVEQMRTRQVKLAQQMQELAAGELQKVIRLAKKTKDAGAIDQGLILKLIDVGSKLERLNLGEPSEITQTNADVDPFDLSALSVDELRALKRMRAKLRRTSDEDEAEGGDT